MNEVFDPHKSDGFLLDLTNLGGVLSLSSDANLGTGTIHLGNDAELLTTGANFSSGKTVFLANGGGTVAGANGTTATYTGVISGTGPFNIGDGINQGTVVLSAANTNSGGTFLNAGVLVANGAQALGLGDVVVRGGVLTGDAQSINVKGNYTQNTPRRFAAKPGRRRTRPIRRVKCWGARRFEWPLQLFFVERLPAKDW